MAGQAQRIGVIGASSLLGKELAEELAESALASEQVILLDDDEAAGQLASSGDEPAVIQKLEASSFERLDFVFFAGSPETTRHHWQNARRRGATIVDLTDALEAEPSVLVRAPWMSAVLGAAAAKISNLPDLNTAGIVAAHPAALMLALAAGRIHAKLPVSSIIATVMEPASEYGRKAMDELHQQTVSLLSFHDLPREQYDAQVAFNLLPEVGQESKISFADTQKRIERHFSAISGDALPPIDLHLIHAPVFHGHTASVLVELREPATAEQVEGALAGEHIELVTDDSDPPSNLSASAQRNVLVRVRKSSGSRAGRRFWLWLATDNLKLASANAIACATELRRFRPQGKVQ